MTRPMSTLAIAGAIASVCILEPSGLQAQTCPADADQRGCWQPLIDWGIPFVAAHSIMLKTGKVLSLDNITNSIWLFDPADDSMNVLVEKAEKVIFCSGHSQLPDGRVAFMGGGGSYDPGGHAQTVIFDPDKAVAPYDDPAMWTQMDDIPPIDPPEGDGRRWYPTCTTLGNGKVLVLGGGFRDDFGNSDLPLIFDPTAAPTNQYTPLDAGAQKHFPWYPFTYVLPNGDIFMAGADEYPDSDPNCSLPPCEGDCPAVTPTLNLPLAQWTDVGYKTGVSNISGGSACMFRPGRVMKAGGIFDPNAPDPADSCSGGPSNATTEVRMVNLNVATPEWDSKASMIHPRVDFYLVPMPDGNVLAVGDGSSNLALEPEIYDVAADTWTEMAPMDVGRDYHSSAVLMPNARIFHAGGELPNYSVQIFEPPYLFTNGNDPAVQTEIVTAPAEIYYSTRFEITTGTGEAGDITSASLIRLGSATHSFDHDTRFVPINFTFNPQFPERLRLVGPAHKFLAPPGYYMLFILDDGVPCKDAAIVKLGQPPT